MKVPYVDLSTQNEPFIAEMLEATERVLRNGNFVLGAEVQRLEETLAEFIDVPHVVSCSSGTSALTLAMRAKDIGPGDEVITVSHSFVATATSIRLVGATPVFVDVRYETGLIDCERLKAALSSKTKAILCVHLGGIPCDLDPLVEFCREHGLELIEDCAQAIGSKYAGKHVGTFGTGCFSLHPLKTLSACGDAGFVTTSDTKTADRLRTLRNIGLVSRDELVEVGENARLDTLHAALLLVKMSRLSEFVARRNEHAAMYRGALGSPVKHFEPPANAVPAYSCFAIRVPHRDQLLEALRGCGVDAKIHYPVPIHLHKPFAPFADRESLPVTNRLSKEILSLPVTPEMSETQRQFVIDSVLNNLVPTQ